MAPEAPRRAILPQVRRNVLSIVAWPTTRVGAAGCTTAAECRQCRGAVARHTIDFSPLGPIRCPDPRPTRARRAHRGLADRSALPGGPAGVDHLRQRPRPGELGRM